MNEKIPSKIYIYNDLSIKGVTSNPFIFSLPAQYGLFTKFTADNFNIYYDYFTIIKYYVAVRFIIKNLNYLSY